MCSQSHLGLYYIIIAFWMPLDRKTSSHRKTELRKDELLSLCMLIFFQGHYSNMQYSQLPPQPAVWSSIVQEYFPQWVNWLWPMRYRFNRAPKPVRMHHLDWNWSRSLPIVLKERKKLASVQGVILDGTSWEWQELALESSPSMHALPYRGIMVLVLRSLRNQSSEFSVSEFRIAALIGNLCWGIVSTILCNFTEKQVPLGPRAWFLLFKEQRTQASGITVKRRMPSVLLLHKSKATFLLTQGGSGDFGLWDTHKILILLE